MKSVNHCIPSTLSSRLCSLNKIISFCSNQEPIIKKSCTMGANTDCDVSYFSSHTLGFNASCSYTVAELCGCSGDISKSGARSMQRPCLGDWKRQERNNILKCFSGRTSARTTNTVHWSISTIQCSSCQYYYIYIII